jgi:hypothetical protein
MSTNARTHFFLFALFVLAAMIVVRLVVDWRDPVHHLVWTIKHPFFGADAYDDALVAVKRKGLGDRAAVVLAKLLKDEDPSLRQSAAYALGTIAASPEVVRPILQEALNDPNPSVRHFAFYSLGSIRPAHEPTVTVVLGFWDDTDQQTRHEAIGSLERMHPLPDAAIPKVIDSLKDERRIAAARILIRLGQRAASAAPLLQRELSKLPDGSDRCTMAEALWSVSQDPKAPVSALVELLRSDSLLVRWEAVTVLGRIGPPARDAIPAILDCIRHCSEATLDTAHPDNGMSLRDKFRSSKPPTAQEMRPETLYSNLHEAAIVALRKIQDK